MKKWFKAAGVRAIKTISKYVVNILNMINMLLLGLANVWN